MTLQPNTQITPETVGMLKACPFCGGKATLVAMSSYMVPQCASCGATSGQHAYRTAALAATDWNRRPAASPVNAKPTRCYCPPDRCDAPVIMGRRAGCFRNTTTTPAPSAGDATVDWERVGPKMVEAINGEINWLKAVVSVCSDSGVVIGAKHSLRQMRKAAALAAATPGGK